MESNTELNEAVNRSKLRKEIKSILVALNSVTGSMVDKYPFGNAELTKRVKELESMGLIRFNTWEGFWLRV